MMGKTPSLATSLPESQLETSCWTPSHKPISDSLLSLPTLLLLIKHTHTVSRCLTQLLAFLRLWPTADSELATTRFFLGARPDWSRISLASPCLWQAFERSAQKSLTTAFCFKKPAAFKTCGSNRIITLALTALPS